MTLIKVLFISILTLLLIGMGVWACSQPAASRNFAGPGPEKPAVALYPDFPITFYQGQEILGGKEPRFASLLQSGRPIVVNYWASNCPPCSREMPEFEKVYRAYGGKVLFLGLDVGRFFPAFGDEEDSKQELRRLGITYPAGTPHDTETVASLGIRALPSTEFVSPKGERLRVWSGILNERKLTELVDELLQGSATRK